MKIPIGLGQFWHGDCLEMMRDIPSGSVDMVVTSPPYDELRSYNGMPAFTFDTFRPIADELARVIKPGGVIVWNVGDATVDGSETGSSFRQALYFKDVCGLRLHDTMIWNKGGFSAVGALATRYAPVFEYMFVLSKGAPVTFNPLKDKPNKWAGSKQHGTVRQVDGSVIAVNGLKTGKTIADFGQRYNVWEIPPEKNSKAYGHPAMFPVAIPHDHILSWSNPGDMVLDPFGGSGTTAIAAEQAYRRWICIERDPDYFTQAVARCLDHAVST